MRKRIVLSLQQNSDSMSKKECILSMSKHLFWDVDVKTLDLDKHKAYIVQRVLEYGMIEDWILLKHQLGIQDIAEVCKSLRTLDPKALAFISLISKTPKSDFRCYTTKQSSPTLWNS